MAALGFLVSSLREGEEREAGHGILIPDSYFSFAITTTSPPPSLGKVTI